MLQQDTEILPEYGEVRPEEELDWAKLAAYLRGKIAGADAPLQVKQFHGGHSNLTYLLRFGQQEWVMRRPPFGPLPPSAHDMAREHRVLSRLWQGFKPAPRAVLLCEDPSIIGAPFFIMERRSGIVIRNRQPLPPELGTDPKTFRAISEGFIDTLADLHSVDYENLGLADLGRPVGFVERQITGWMGRWEKAKTTEVPLMNKLGAWFLDNMPPPQAPSLLHNDFFLHNVMFERNNPRNVAGVFDWEMATTGDPMVDVGTSLGYWRNRDDPEELVALSQGYAHTTLPGFMTRDELAERYARRSGRDLSQIAFYQAWANWKTATVVQQIYVRYVRGQTSDPRFASFGPHPAVWARAAARIAARLGFKE